MICGVGVNDVYGARTNKGELGFIYTEWKRMIERCYSESNLKRRPTYRDVSVCDRWLILSNFIEDIKLLPNYDLWLNSHLKGEKRIWSLDKDLKQNSSSKIYSIETCQFILVSQNSSESLNRARREGKHPSRPSKHEKGVIAVFIESDEYFYFSSKTLASNALKVQRGDINRIIVGERKSSKGWKFEEV